MPADNAKYVSNNQSTGNFSNALAFGVVDKNRMFEGVLENFAFAISLSTLFVLVAYKGEELHPARFNRVGE